MPRQGKIPDDGDILRHLETVRYPISRAFPCSTTTGSTPDGGTKLEIGPEMCSSGHIGEDGAEDNCSAGELILGAEPMPAQAGAKTA